jgi:ferredoxin-NADP reductase
MAARLFLAISFALIDLCLWFTGAGLWRCWLAARLARRHRLQRRELQLEVLERDDHGAFARLLLATPGKARRLPAFQAGDYLVLHSEGQRVQRRCYSLAAWQRRPRHYELVIKREEGGVVSGWVHDHLRVGSRVRTSVPRGSFHLDHRREGVYVLIGAGVGITPMRAMLHERLARVPQGRIVLFWSVRQRVELMDYHQEFLDLAARYPGFDYRPRLTGYDPSWQGERGRLGAAELLACVGGLAGVAGVWICASHAMTEQLRDSLQAEGLDEQCFHSEAFAAQPLAETREFPVRLLPEGRELEYRSHPSLLHLLDASGIDLRSECRSGSCGQCRLRLCAGEVEWVIRPEVDLPEGQLLACCVRPQSAVDISIE